MITFVARLLCGWRTGHHLIYRYDAGCQRMFTTCMDCGWEQPGYHLDDLRPPRPRFPGDPQRHRLHQPHIVRRRVS